jgi:hypothetical protein
MKRKRWQHISVLTDDPDRIFAHYEQDGFEMISVLYMGNLVYRLFFKREVEVNA